jgi:hypothetical protein
MFSFCYNYDLVLVSNTMIVFLSHVRSEQCSCSQHSSDFSDLGDFSTHNSMSLCMSDVVRNITHDVRNTYCICYHCFTLTSMCQEYIVRSHDV